MSKLVQRLLIFFIGMPVVLGIVFLDYYHHLPLNIAIIMSSAIAANELYNIFSRKTRLLPRPLVISLSAVLPLISYLFTIFNVKTENLNDLINWAFLFAAMILMAWEVYSRKTFESSNTSLSGSIFIVFYTGFLLTFLNRIALLEHSTVYLVIFLFTVFITDSLAWLFGVTMGKNNRGIVAASPNKSAAGFIGGMIGAMAAVTLSMFLLSKGEPEYSSLFGTNYGKGALLGFLCSLAAITGDLVESVFKRSSEVKDSGNIIPGRGGILDSIDSILFTAPVFYVAVHLLNFVK